MARYDWRWGPGYDRDIGARRRRGPESSFERFDQGWGGDPGGRFRGSGGYGQDHPAYGGYPGGRDRGMYYGGYDSELAREPFLPEEAYRRHPEFDRPQRHGGGAWPAGMGAGRGGRLDDREIRRSVRQNLYGDSWIDPDRIRVQVEDGVVTLAGEVDDYLEARYAWDDAWESTGVRGVINQLTVRTDRPSEPHGDVLPQTE